MTRMSIVEARDHMADALNRVAYAGERVVLERRGKGVAAMVSMEDLALLEAMEDQVDVRAAHKARAEGGRPIPVEKVAARLGVSLPKRAGGRRKR